MIGMSSPDHTQAGARPAKVKCLLVDDLPENLLALAALLRQDDVEVIEARSGTQALELLLQHEVALALIDVQMPEMDGFELAELIRGSERTRHIPLIFVTAGARDQHRVFTGYEAGAVDFLYKPIDPMILRNKANVFFQLDRQRQQLARELHERTETLRLNEMFTAVLGHDLRNPLSAILMSAASLQRKAQDEAVRKAASDMVGSARRMCRMIDDLLDLARLRLGGGMPLEPKPVDLADLIQPIVQEHRSARPECEIEILRQGDLRGYWDADRLNQVASNLIGNSLQHGDLREPIRIELDGNDAHHVSLSVANAGAIPSQLIAGIFDPFKRARGHGKRSEGIGLGLYIVQQIVQSHHGTVDVRADAADRTVFSVQIPRDARRNGQRLQ